MSVVEVASGRLRGREEGGILAFKGVRYAQAGRFQAPQLPSPWAGIRDALAYGPSCPQPSERPQGWSAEPSQDEDCLVLNVWTPGTSGRRPVMVWLHGGGFDIGSGSWPLYDGTALARRGDVVVVTVNHRLGPFGFLDLEDAPNVGLQDLVAALRWVRDNITAFGGDPTNVTIFGESGGGAKVSVLHVMPDARGLFHRAIIQSGPGLRVLTREQAAAHRDQLLAALGGADPRRVSAARLLAAVPRQRGLSGFRPFLDGRVVAAQPEEALAAGTAADVPLLIGRNRDEGTLQLAADPVLREPELLDEAGLRERLGELARLLPDYRAAYPQASRLDLLIAIRTDAWMGRATARLAEQRLKGGTQPVYMYRFEWGAGPLRSAHGYEIAFVFDNARPPVMGESLGRAELAARMSEAWIAFARDGDPNHGWPPYTLEERFVMIFGRDGCRVARDPFEAVRGLWSG